MFKIDYNYLKNIRNKINADGKNTLGILLEFHDSKDPEDVKSFEFAVNLLNKTIAKTVELLHTHYKKDFFIDYQNLVFTLLSKQEFGESEKDYFPVVVYVGTKKEDTIGISVSYTGSMKIFEGNDEASPETYDLINEIIGKPPELVQVYGNHGAETVDRILITRTLPVGLFVTPNKNHALAHWDLSENRELFTGLIYDNTFSKHHDLDWQITKPSPIQNFKIL